MKDAIRKLMSVTPYELQRRSRPSDLLTNLQLALKDDEGSDEGDLSLFLKALNLVVDRGLIPEGQLLQDVFALSRTGSGSGTYVDCGAGHPQRLSNTYLLQHGFGWQGLLIEPNPEFNELLRQREAQGANLSRKAAGSPGIVDFLCDAELSGATDQLRSDWAAKTKTRTKDHRRLLRVEREPLGETLLRVFGSPRVLSYLSIDVEGGELDVISTLDLTMWRFRAITIEHNFVPGVEQQRTETLNNAGYRRVLTHLTSFDAWFVPED